MPSRTLTPTNGLRSYPNLLVAVRNSLLHGQQKIEEARVLTYLETGRLINEHVRLNGGRAEYGAQVISRLARDLKIARTTLYQCTQFARYFPIVRHGGQLVWAHYRLFCQVDDEAQREALVEQTVKNHWTSPELQDRVREFNARDPDAGNAGDETISQRSSRPKPLSPKRGTVGVYRVVASGGGLAVDLGFTSYVDLPTTTKWREGSLVRLDSDGNFVAANDASKCDLYTYRAEVLRVVDGDTLWMKIYLEPGRWVKEKLRLRGLDCPELATSEGKTAKRLVNGLVAQARGVTITTSKPDKWDRYLSDVYLAQESGDDLFLNNHLLAAGQARRMDEYALTDWDGDLSKPE
ncbi:MAG: thermonuclease family protein [Verrucomicrobia bacterium]|nr:thermonuclease family protein [Verrucomicrobiota bacterium]